MVAKVTPIKNCFRLRGIYTCVGIGRAGNGRVMDSPAPALQLRLNLCHSFVVLLLVASEGPFDYMAVVAKIGAWAISCSVAVVPVPLLLPIFKHIIWWFQLYPISRPLPPRHHPCGYKRRLTVWCQSITWTNADLPISNFFIEENAFEIIFCKKVAILFRFGSQWVKGLLCTTIFEFLIAHSYLTSTACGFWNNHPWNLLTPTTGQICHFQRCWTCGNWANKWNLRYLSDHMSTLQI